VATFTVSGEQGGTSCIVLGHGGLSDRLGDTSKFLDGTERLVHRA
jgi:hypothetical protein